MEAGLKTWIRGSHEPNGPPKKTEVPCFSFNGLKKLKSQGSESLGFISSKNREVDCC